nr:hypothetical protein BaRGS_034430 [Batillaria attramentaria]
MSECTTPLVTSAPIPTPTTTTPRPTPARARNYGPGGTMFDYSDTIRQTDNTKGDGEEEPSAFQFSK